MIRDTKRDPERVINYGIVPPRRVEMIPLFETGVRGVARFAAFLSAAIARK
jgi:hypothetical protein